MGLFKRKPERPADLESALNADGPLKDFSAVVLSTLAPAAGEAFAQYAIFEPESHGELVEGAAKLATLQSLMESQSISVDAAAEAIASITNIVLIQLVDEAVSTLKEDDGKTLAALAQLQEFMSGAGELFQSLTPNAAIKPVK